MIRRGIATMLRPTPLHPKYDEKEDGRPTQRASSSMLRGLAILWVRVEEMHESKRGQHVQDLNVGLSGPVVNELQCRSVLGALGA